MKTDTTFKIRAYQTWQKFLKTFVPFKQPEMYSGTGAVDDINHVLLHKKHQVHNVLIVTGSQIYKKNLINPIFENLKRNGINYSVYSGCKPNPTAEQVEEGVLLYKKNRCEAIVAIGGGSVIDVAKCIGARAGNSKTPLSEMVGVMKVKNDIPLLIAIPTTAGSGSDASFTAELLDSKNKSKYSIVDPKLLPKYVILDPNLIIDLNKEQIAFSGMDALTHAIEAYLSKAHTMKSDRFAIDGAKLICDNLELAYSNNEHDKNALKLHENLLNGAHYAGLALSRAYAGFCHAISHAIGGKYNLPHGYLNAIILPYVLKAYGDSAIERLAKLADQIAYRISTNNTKKAEWLINRIESMNSYLGIKNNLKDVIDPKEIHALAARAYEEATPLYPAPKMLDIVEIENIINDLIK